MKKRANALILAAALTAGALSGCGNGGNASVTQPEGQSTTVGQESQKSVENVDLKIHFHSGNKYTILDQNGNILPVFQLAAEKNNITLENTANPVAQNSKEEFQLQATEKFPADIYGGDSVRDSIYTYAMQGAFIPLNDLIDQYAPNIRKYLEDHEEIRKAMTASDGNIYMINYVPDGVAGRAYFIRTDWLNKLGLEMPATFDELEKVLYAFRNEDPNGNGRKDEIPVFNDRYPEIFRLANLWGARVYGYDSISERVVLNDQGELYHAWTAPEFKEAIKGMAKWYADGIIDPEVFTRKNNTSRQTLWTKDNTGGMTHEWLASTSSYNDNEELLKQVPDFRVEAMLPVSKNGKAFEEHQRALIKPDGWAISANCKNQEAAIRFMDWFFTEEGKKTINFGIEGESYTLVEGKPVFTDEVLKEGTVNAYLWNNYGAQLPVGYQQDYEYERQWTNEYGQKAYDLYASADIHSAPATPVLNFTVEEREIFDQCITTINEFQDEKMTAFITGKEDVDTGWDAYVQQCRDLGIDDLVGVYQSAYERYLKQ